MMDVAVNGAELRRAVSAVSAAVSKRATLPVLGGIRLGAHDGGLELKGTDLELAVSVRIPAAVRAAGVAIVPARVFAETLKSAGKVEAIGLAVEGASLRVGRASLKVLPVEDYPELAGAAPAAVAFPGPELADAIRRTIPACSKDEARPILTGTLAELEPSGALTLIATDSYRMGVFEVQGTPAPALEAHKIVIPARALALVSKLAGKAPAVTIGLEASRVTFSFGDVVLTSRTIDGEFPNWRQLMPAESPHALVMPAAELEGAIGRAAVYAVEGAPIVFGLEHTPGPWIRAGARDVGEHAEYLEGAELREGPGSLPPRIAFNPAYLLDALRSAGAEPARLALRDALKPALFEGPTGRVLIMPVRVDADKMNPGALDPPAPIAGTPAGAIAELAGAPASTAPEPVTPAQRRRAAREAPEPAPAVEAPEPAPEAPEAPHGPGAEALREALKLTERAREQTGEETPAAELEDAGGALGPILAKLEALGTTMGHVSNDVAAAQHAVNVLGAGFTEALEALRASLEGLTERIEAWERPDEEEAETPYEALAPALAGNGHGPRTPAGLEGWAE